MGGMKKQKQSQAQQQGPLAQLIPFITDAAQRSQQLANRYVPGDVTPGMRPEHAYGGPGTSAVRPPGSMPMPGPRPLPPPMDVEPAPAQKPLRPSMLGGGGKGK